jgi:hypothetical protein
VSALAEPADLGEQPSLTTGTYLASWLAHVRGRVRAKTFDGYEMSAPIPKSSAVRSAMKSHARALVVKRWALMFIAKISFPGLI